LDEKEKDIIVKAFGIDSPKMPITSIANEYQTNNRRINLIINASLKKMKNAEIREYQK
jgi:DNA-directed RNA polymerase sigma subunit (sigma70/sigma32)